MVEVLLHGVSLKMSGCIVTLHVIERPIHPYFMFSSNEHDIYPHPDADQSRGPSFQTRIQLKVSYGLRNVREDLRFVALDLQAEMQTEPTLISRTKWSYDMSAVWIGNT